MYPQLYNLVKQRYSCRQYLDKPVGRDLIAAGSGRTQQQGWPAPQRG